MNCLPGELLTGAYFDNLVCSLVYRGIIAFCEFLRYISKLCPSSAILTTSGGSSSGSSCSEYCNFLPNDTHDLLDVRNIGTITLSVKYLGKT